VCQHRAAGDDDIGKTIPEQCEQFVANLNTAGQSIDPQTASSQLSSMLGILNLPSRRPLSVFGTAVTTLGGIEGRHHEWHDDAGRIEAVIAERKQAMSYHRARPSRHLVADGDVGAGGGRFAGSRSV